MSTPTAPLGSYPTYNVPFPYQNLPQQLQASFTPPSGQFTSGAQYGRWNGVNNNAFGLFPSQWPSVFGSPTAPPMQYQPPWGNNGTLQSNQGPGSNPGMTPPPSGPPPQQMPNPGQTPIYGTMGTPVDPNKQPVGPPNPNMPPLYPQTPGLTYNVPPSGYNLPNKMGVASTPTQAPGTMTTGQQYGTAPYNPNQQPGSSMWGNTTGPVNVGALTPTDQLYLQKMMHMPGMPGMIGNMLQGSNMDVRNALSTLGGQADPYDNTSQVNNYDPSTYNGQLKPLFQQYFQNNPQAMQMATAAGYGNLFGGL